MLERSTRLPRPLTAAPGPPRRIRWVTRLFVVAAPVILLAGAVKPLFTALRLVRKDAAPLLASEATTLTGHETRLGSLSFEHPGLLILQNISISAGNTFAERKGETFGAAAKITVRYDWRSMLFDVANAGHYVQSITVDRPNVLVERIDNTHFNFSPLVDQLTKKKPQPNRKAFIAYIALHDATARFRDFKPRDGWNKPAAFNAVTGEAVVDCRSDNLVAFSGAGHGLGTRFAAVNVRGDASRLVKGRFQLTVHAENADAPYWTDYFIALPAVRVRGGRADIDLTLSQKELTSGPAHLEVAGFGTLRQGEIGLATLTKPLRDVNGDATFTSDDASFRGRISLAGQKFAGYGSFFRLLGGSPQIALNAQAPHLDVQALAKAVPAIPALPGLNLSPGPVTAVFTGPASKPDVALTAALPSVSYQGTRATDLRARLLISGKAATIPSLTFRIGQTGRVTARAFADSTQKNNPQVVVSGHASGVNLASLVIPGASKAHLPKIAGIADADFLASSRGHPLSVVANFSVANPHVFKTQLRSVRGRVLWSPERALVLSKAVITDDKGAATVSGSAPYAAGKGHWNMAVSAIGLRLRPLLSPYLKEDVSGVAAFDGHITGLANAPRADGRLQVEAPRYGRIFLDAAQGHVAASSGGIRLQDMQVARFPTQVHLDGTATSLASGNPQLNFGVRFSQGDVQDFISLANQLQLNPPKKTVAGVVPSKTAKALTAALPTITGTASGRFQIGGTLKSPQAAGHVRVQNATVAAYRIEDVSANLAYRRGTLTVANGAALAEGAAATLNGQWQTKTGAIQARFGGSNLALSQFQEALQPYADVNGVLNFSGAVSGTVKDPRVRAGVVAENVVVNGQEFATFSLFGRYADGVFTKVGDPTEIAVTPTPGEQATDYVLDGLTLTVPTPNHPTRRLFVNALAHVPADAPERLTHLIQTVRDSRFAQSKAGRATLASLDRLPRPLDGEFSIPQVSISGPLNALAIVGTVQGAGLQVGENSARTAQATIQAVTGGRPAVHVTASATDLVASQVPINTVSADVGYDEKTATGRDSDIHRVVTVNTLQARSNRAFLTGKGTADLDGQIDANLDVSNIPLSLFNRLFPSVQDATAKTVRTTTLDGDVRSLFVQASGATKSPDLVGSISVDKPTVTTTVAALTPNAADAVPTTHATYSLDSIRSGAISLASDPTQPSKVLTVNDLAAFKNGQPIATLSGTLGVGAPGAASSDASPVTVSGEPLHADLRIGDLGALAFLSPTIDPKKTSGSLVASIDTFGAATPDHLSGVVTLANAALGLLGFETTLKNANGVILVRDGVATIQSLSAKSNKGGDLKVSGRAALRANGGLNARIDFNKLRLDETDKQTFLVKTYNSGAKGTLNGGLSVRGPWTALALSNVSGSPLIVTDALGSLPTLPTSSGGQATVPPIDPKFDLTVQLGNSRQTVGVRSPLLRADAYGSVRLAGQLTAPRLSASLNIVKGQFIIPPSTLLKFIPPQGTVDLEYPVPATDAAGNPISRLRTVVNLRAQTNQYVSPSVFAANQSALNGAGGAYVGTARQPLAQPQLYTITLDITGELNNPNLPLDPKIDPTSSPPGLTKQQMLASIGQEGTVIGLLGGTGGAEGVIRTQVAQAFNTLALPALLDPAESRIASVLGLSTFSVDYTPDSPVLVTLSKLLSNRLQATYSRFLGARTPGAVNSIVNPQQYTLKLGYSLTNRLQFSLSTDDQRNNTAAIEGIVSF